MPPRRRTQSQASHGKQTQLWQASQEYSKVIQPNFFHKHLPKILVALTLTLASGLVDVVGYFGIYRLFTAHLTGTTAQLGHSLASRNWMHASVAIAIVSAFFAGSVLARVLIEIASRKRFRKIASITLILEAICLVIVAIKHVRSDGGLFWDIAALAAGMGIQTATLTGIGPLTVHTTFVTGMVNKLAQLSSHMGFRAFDLRRKNLHDANKLRNQQRDVRLALFLVSIWGFYVAGAALGTWSFLSWGLHALFIAVGLLLLSFVTDQIWPIAIREEKEQSEG